MLSFVVGTLEVSHAELVEESRFVYLLTMMDTLSLVAVLWGVP